jgi:hypothetical protein
MWYTTAEMTQFRRDAVEFAEFVFQANRESNDPELWPKLLLRAYRGACSASSPENVFLVMDTTQAPRNDEWMGIEKWAIRQINVDSKRRRRQIWRVIRWMQDATLPNELIKTQMTRQALRKQSGPSVKYAYYKANLVARSLYTFKETTTCCTKF